MVADKLGQLAQYGLSVSACEGEPWHHGRPEAVGLINFEGDQLPPWLPEGMDIDHYSEGNR